MNNIQHSFSVSVLCLLHVACHRLHQDTCLMIPCCDRVRSGHDSYFRHTLQSNRFSHCKLFRLYDPLLLKVADIFLCSCKSSIQLYLEQLVSHLQSDLEITISYITFISNSKTRKTQKNSLYIYKNTFTSLF